MTMCDGKVDVFYWTSNRIDHFCVSEFLFRGFSFSIINKTENEVINQYKNLHDKQSHLAYSNLNENCISRLSVGVVI